ncbi:MAG: ABC transporter substrate-binding protein [Lachnospiraceae bacterium]|nr:ABC transporter substrate-binding protein [Lachnospiraceae bacterium]
MKKRIFSAIAIILLLCCTGILCSCSQTAQKTSKKNYVTIGRICPMSGEFAEYGYGTLEAEKAAVKELNENGGIFIDALDKKLMVRYLLADSCSTEEGAKEAAIRLIEEENVDLIIVSHTSSTVDPVSQICEEKKVPCFCCDADMETWLAQGDHTYSFLISAGTMSRLDAFRDVWTETDLTSLGLITDESSAAEAFSKAVISYCANNRITVREYNFTGNLARTLSEAKADGILCYLDTGTYLSLKNDLDEAGVELKCCMLVNEHLYYDALGAASLGSAFDGTYTAVAWGPSFTYQSSLTGQDGAGLKEWWDSEYVAPCPESLGYKHGIVEVAVEALKRAMAIDADSIVKAATELNIETVLGPVHFDEAHAVTLPCAASQWIYDAHSVGISKWSQILTPESIGKKQE